MGRNFFNIIAVVILFALTGCTTPKKEVAQDTPTATAVAVTPTPVCDVDTSAWVAFNDADLGHTMQMPASWTTRHHASITYIDFNEVELPLPVGSAYPFSFHVYEEIREPGMSFEETATRRLPADLKALFTWEERTFGTHQAFTTVWMPSMDGQYTIFLDMGSRYLVFGLVPYDEPWQNEEALREKIPGHKCLFETVASTVTVP
jgi:hypothetical protein